MAAKEVEVGLSPKHDQSLFVCLFAYVLDTLFWHVERTNIKKEPTVKLFIKVYGGNTSIKLKKKNQLNDISSRLIVLIEPQLRLK